MVAHISGFNQFPLEFQTLTQKLVTTPMASWPIPKIARRNAQNVHKSSLDNCTSAKRRVFQVVLHDYKLLTCKLFMLRCSGILIKKPG